MLMNIICGQWIQTWLFFECATMKLKFEYNGHSTEERTDQQLKSRALEVVSKYNAVIVSIILE